MCRIRNSFLDVRDVWVCNIFVISKRISSDSPLKFKMTSVFEHGLKKRQDFAFKQGPIMIPQVAFCLRDVLNWEKPDTRKAGGFCFICFLNGIDALNLEIFNTTSATTEEHNNLKQKIISVLSKVSSQFFQTESNRFEVHRSSLAKVWSSNCAELT